jgi:signal peptidase I
LKPVNRARELQRAELAEARKDSFLEILEAIVIALLLALTIRTFVVQAFKIPSGSMIPTLLIGDHILVNKFLYGTRLPFVNDRLLPIRHPRRGDVLVFKFPKDHRTDYIKRLVGQPGDVVEMAGRRVYVNGRLWKDDPGRYEGAGRPAWAVPGDSIRFGPIYVPRKGDKLQVVKGQLRVNGRAFDLPQARIVDEGILKDYFSIFYGGLLPPGMVMDANTTTPVERVKEDRYFMMGDNRDNSRDGRFWGFVRDSEIRGKAFLIYWSWNGEEHWVRWGRMGDLVR